MHPECALEAVAAGVPPVSAFWRRLAELRDEGRALALCTVVESHGSVPRHAGAHMIVLGDGAIVGSVGGAGFEERVRALALEALARGETRPAVHRFDLWYKHAGGLDSLCGGSVTVTIDPMQRPTHVLICGAGHVGLALARILEVNEYAYSVVDDRPDYATAERFPGAAERFCGDSAAVLRDRDPGRYTHAVFLGYSHRLDLALLAALLPRLGGWVGAIGSRAKAVELRARLQAAGVSEADVARLRCPIGLDIGAETAAEIATSIAAEIVATSGARRREDQAGGSGSELEPHAAGR